MLSPGGRSRGRPSPSRAQPMARGRTAETATAESRTVRSFALVFLWTKDLTVLLSAVAVSVVLPLAIGWALLGDGRPRLRPPGDSMRAEGPGRKRWRAGAGPHHPLTARRNHPLTARRSVFGWTLVTVI